MSHTIFLRCCKQAAPCWIVLEIVVLQSQRRMFLLILKCKKIFHVYLTPYWQFVTCYCYSFKGTTRANQKVFAPICFGQMTNVKQKPTYTFEVVDCSWAGLIEFPVAAGSSAAVSAFKMAGVLNTSTAYEQRSVIRFLWSKGRTPI